MKSSVWKKTADSVPDAQWDVELGDTIAITDNAGGWAVSLAGGHGVEEGRGEQFGTHWYPSQARDALERDLKDNGFTLFMGWGGLKRA